MNIKESFLSNKKRAVTAITLLSVVFIIATIDNIFLTWAFLGLAYLFAFYESMELFRNKNNALFVYAVAIWLTALIYPNPDDIGYIVIIIALSAMVYKKEVNLPLLAPFAYPTISMLFLYTLYLDFGMMSLVWLVVIVALTDTGAYIIGKSIGKTPFSKTSPNKTWEGVLGGVATATVFGTLFGLSSVELSTSFIISLLVSVSSVYGDLFESYLKREAGVKDSGTLFPGHGGMLDRIDGYLFASVIMVILLRGLL